MSAELKDLRAKIGVKAYAFLEARSRVTGIDISTQVREILHEWANDQLHIATVADGLMRSEGMPGIAGEPQGISGKRDKTTGVRALVVEELARQLKPGGLLAKS
jgi:hypothetical protein